MKTFFVEMITPERMFFKGNIEQLVVETVDGYMGILAGHVPTVTALKHGSIRFFADGKWNEVANSAGFVEIRPDETIVLAQALEWPYEIDANRGGGARRRGPAAGTEQKGVRALQGVTCARVCKIARKIPLSRIEYSTSDPPPKQSG